MLIVTGLMNHPVVPRLCHNFARTICHYVCESVKSTAVDSDFGFGDTTQSLFFSPKEPVGGWILGFGPVALLPTGTQPRLRSEQLGLGPTAVALQQKNGWTYGALVNHIWGVTQSDDHDEVNSTFLQPFVTYTWPTGTTLTLNAEATYDWTAHDLTLPLNLTVSQLMKIGGQPVQFQIGPRYYAVSPDNGPEWGVRFTITFLFPK
jgi:hypothetical protein